MKDDRLTKADTVALWYAVYNYGFMVDAIEGNTELRDLERKRHRAAKRALRKVNALRKQGL